MRFVLFAAVLAGPGFSQEPPVEEPQLLPVQFVQPGGNATAAPVPSGPVADPPTPTVRIQVRVPSHIAPNKDVTYKIVVSNPSAAVAYRVQVRNPVPAGCTVVKSEPRPDKADPGTDLIWKIGTMHPGETKEIELVLHPGPEVKELSNQAFVSFEHGQRVTTKIDKGKLAVRKTAPAKASTGEPIPVRVEITNTSRVAVSAVELVEDVSKGFEFSADTDAEKTTNPQQRIFKLGTLKPGERKIIEYKLTTRDAPELLAQSMVKSPDAPEQVERAEAGTKVLNAALTLDLAGPASVTGGEPALYTVKVTNSGTMSLSDIRVTATLPSDCTLTKMTNGGQRYRDQIVWTIPDKQDGPLKPGQTFELRFGLKANTGGPRTVRAAAEVGKIEKSQELRMTFEGTAVLHWTASPDLPTLTVGRQGQLLVRVSNQGGEAAKNVRLRIRLPQGVSLVQASPRNQSAANEVVFDAITVPANAMEKFTLTYEATKAGQAWFDLKLTADILGERPLTKEQAIEITGGR